MKKFVINKFDSNQSLFKFTKKILKNAPLSFIYRIFRKKDVKVNGIRENDKYVLRENDEVLLYITDEQFDEFTLEKELESSNEVKKYIIYEDENILVINKPRGMLVQEDGTRDTSLDVLVKQYLLLDRKPTDFLGSPCHRIDRNTSGIVIFGKTLEATQEVTKLFKDHENISKKYLTLVKGEIDDNGRIDVPLIKNEKLNKVFISSLEEGGKESITLYSKIFSKKDVSLVSVTLLTGRSHQIRVHMAHINHPIVGDQKYGDFNFNKDFEKSYNFKNQFLHASELSFKNITGKLNYLSGKDFLAPLPKDEQDIIDRIKAVR